MNNIDKLKTYKHILCICESPNKVASISKIFKDIGLKNIFVYASVGHISQIANSGIFNMGINPETFEMDLQITEDKKEVVKKLKEQVDLSDLILLASDPDREGEAIAWSLKKFLKIPEKKYQRIVYHEITKSALEKSLNNPIKINDNLVSAAHTRSRLDKIVGFRLSPIAINKLGARSVGRCQSAGLKLVVDREKEIRNFKVTTFYEMYLNFKKNEIEFKAKYKNKPKLESIEECDTIAKECKGNDYIISNIEQKLTKQNSPLPFITSTFQQECASKLGLSIKTIMSCAQRLYEGLNIKGEHIALTTYLRTDSTTISDEFIPKIKTYIVDNFGEKYYQGIKMTKKKDLAQEGHECYRVVDLEMTPSKLKKYVKDEILIKVYSLIYNRTIASLMSAREIFETNYEIKNGSHIFSLTSKEEKFDGWKKVYNIEKDKEEIIKETFTKNEILKDTSLERFEKETQPPARYTEASLVKTLDKLGIGRPSTYATIISTLLDEGRGYCRVVDKKMIPSELAIKLVEFLDNNFPNIVNSSYTAHLEQDLDKISKGEMEDTFFLKSFYNGLEIEINKVSPTQEKVERLCPKCGSKLVFRTGKYGAFIGCSDYPKCKYAEKVKKKS